MASKGFEFIQGNERLDWGVLVAIDVERLMSSSKSGDPISTGANIDTLQRIVENIAFSRITHDEAKLFTADHVLHLFQLAQFVIQYLVYCQDTLATMNVRLSSRTEENERRLSRLEQQRHALENDNAKLRKDVKSMRRTLTAYESTQHLLENNYKYQNRFPRRYHSNPHMPARRMEPCCHTSHQRRRSNITHPSGYYTTDDYDAHYDSETEYDDNSYVQGVRHTHTAQNGTNNHQNYYYNNKVNQPMKQRRSDRQRSREEPTMQYICQWCGDGYHKIESLQSHLRKRHASRVVDSNVAENNNVEHKTNSTQPLPPQMKENGKNYKNSNLNDRHIPHNQYLFEQESERQKREQYQNSDNKDDGNDGGEGKKTSKQLERLEEELNRMKDELHKSKLMEMEKREQLLLSLLQQKSADRMEVETRKPITPTPNPQNNYESVNKVTSTSAEPVIPPLALPGLPLPNTYVQSQEAQKQFHTNHKHQHQHQQEQPYEENKQHEMANTTHFVTSPERHSLVQTTTTTTRGGGGVGNNNYNTNQGKENSANINFVDSTENRIQSIPVMPDVEAASAYNTTRAHELTNNALMRQMLELQDEIKALKIGTSDEHTHSAMPVNKVEGAPPLHVTLPVPQHTVPQPAGPSPILTSTLTTPTSSSIAPAQRTEEVQDEDREAVNLAKYGPPGPSFVPPEILSRRSLSLSGSANKMIESSPTPQTATAATATATTQQPEEQKLKHHDKQEATPHHHNHREHEYHTHHHTHHKEEEKQEIKEQEKLLQHTERSTEPNASTKVLQSSLVVPSSIALPTPVPVLPTNTPTSIGQTEHEHKLGPSNADNKMIAIKKINDTGDHNKKNKNTLLSTSSSSTLSSTGTSYSSSSSSSSYSTSPSQTSSTSLSKSTMPPSSVQPTSLSIPAAPSTINAIPVPIPTIHSNNNNNNNNFFQPTLPQQPKIQQPELLQHSEHVQQSEKLNKEEAKEKEEHHHHKHRQEQEKQEEQRKASAIPIPVPINPTVVTTGISSSNSKTNLSSVPAVIPSPYATASYMTGIASYNTVGSKLDHNNSHFSVALPAKGNESNKEKTSNTANNNGSSNNKEGLLATLKITPPPDSHSSSLSSSSSSYSASSSGSSSSSGSYSYSSSGSYSSSSETSSSTSKDKVQTISKTTTENRSNIVASNTYLNNNRGNEQYSSSSSYSYEQKSS